MKSTPLCFAACATVLALATTANAASLGKNPAAGLIQGPDGAFYGTTQNGGTNDLGTAFRVDANGFVTSIVNFTGTAGTALGAAPIAPLIFATDGKLYGTTSEGGVNSLGAVFRTSISGSVETLYSFTGPVKDGSYPKGKVTQAADGNFYGMTYTGGANKPAVGTFYRITPDGAETVLNDFDNPEGAYPTSGLTQGRSGNFYGVTFAGGANGLGSIIKLSPDGTRTLIYSFTGDADGSNPQGELVEDPTTAGTFYGVTSNGGANGYGTVYSINTKAIAPATPTPTTIFDFNASTNAANAVPNGANPRGGLVIGTDGFLYGTAFSGGISNGGTAFKVARASGSSPTVLHNFAGTDGTGPNGRLLETSAGVFLGTTYTGGQNNSGTIFSITSTGAFAELVDFANPNGQAPPVINSATSVTINSGSSFNYQITATGSPTSYGANGLPSWLTLNTTTGRITGTVPSNVTGNYSFTILASNSSGTGSSGFQLIIATSAPSITDTTAYAQNGAAFSYQISATNNPTSFSASGLPQGLALTNASVGIISGTPAVSGPYDVLVSASNAAGTGSATLHLVVTQPVPVITGVFTATVLRGNTYTYQIIASNNATSFDAFVLPPGLSIDHNTGVISGAPTIEGTYKYTLTAGNNGGVANQDFTLTVLPPIPVITGSDTAAGIVGNPFSYQITTQEPIITPIEIGPDRGQFVAYGLPPGLTLDSRSGVISGIPTIAGPYSVVLEAGSTGGIGTKTITINIDPARITSPSIATGVVGQLFGYQITSSYTGFFNETFTSTPLPPGLSLSASTGLISGIPTTAGDYQVIVTGSVGGPGGSTGLTSGPVSATITISIAPTGSGGGLVTITTVEFSKANFGVTNTDSSVSLLVNLSRSVQDTGTYTVKYTTVDGTAVAGTDYDTTAGTLTFVAGQGQQTITVPLHAKAAPQPDRSFIVTLSSPSGGVLGQASTATVLIRTPDYSTKLLNISTRGPVEIGDEAMINGFIVQGTVAKKLVLRGMGPSLTALGVSDAIADPTITVVDANGTGLAYNDDYTTNSAGDLATISDAGLTPTSSKESAVVVSLVPGAYTTILRGKANGIGLIETYDVSNDVASKLVNISTRGKVEPNDNGALIAGFIVGAPPNQPGTTQSVVIRAIGPSLSSYGIATALANPTLDLYRGSQLILSNDNWKSNSAADQQTLQAHGLAPVSDKEAAIVTNLDPGAYTAVIRGKNNTTGVALAEVYQLNQ